MKSYNNMNDIRLLALDIDGTILTREKKLTTRTKNAIESISVTESGIFILTKDLQPQKVSFSIFVTPFGIVTLDNKAQSSNALSPIFFTVSGIFTIAKDLQLQKVFGHISVTPFGIVITVSELQFSKALALINCTESGIVICFSEVQPLKAF